MADTLDCTTLLQDEAADMSSGSTENSGQSARKSTRKSGKRASSWVYQRSKNWEYRREYKGNDLSGSGFPTKGAASKELNARLAAIDRNAKPVGAGAGKTSLAQALQDYALAKLPFMKGAPQEARRINNYLRPAGLKLLEVSRCEPSADGPVSKKTGKGKYYEVRLMAHTTERVIPKGLEAHRKALMTQSADTDRHRAVLASTSMAKVTRLQLQELVDAMNAEKHAPATIALERALIRALFNHAHTKWNWSELMENPATKLELPPVQNDRVRILRVGEQAMLDEALAQCRNRLVAPTLDLLRETAMRASEPLEHATWGDVDWERRILKLKDSKTGAREVPLSPGALEALQRLGPGEPDEPLVKITYEALKASWHDACARAGIKDLKIHDLRHTAATRLALKCGNVFLVKALTGHKTMTMVERYINVKPDDVVKFMHETPASNEAPACGPAPAAQSVPEPVEAKAWAGQTHRGLQAVLGNVAVVGFRQAA